MKARRGDKEKLRRGALILESQKSTNIAHGCWNKKYSYKYITSNYNVHQYRK